METSIEVDPGLSFPRSQDPCSETLLVREETPISISSDDLVLSPSLNEVNNNSQGSLSPRQQTLVSSSVSRSEYFYSQYFSCRNCLATVWRSQERLLRSQTLLQIRRPLFWYIAHLRSKLSSRSGVKNFRESPRTGTPSGISSRDSERKIRSWVGNIDPADIVLLELMLPFRQFSRLWLRQMMPSPIK